MAGYASFLLDPEYRRLFGERAALVPGAAAAGVGSAVLETLRAPFVIGEQVGKAYAEGQRPQFMAPELDLLQGQRFDPLTLRLAEMRQRQMEMQQAEPGQHDALRTAISDSEPVGGFESLRKLMGGGEEATAGELVGGLLGGVGVPVGVPARLLGQAGGKVSPAAAAIARRMMETGTVPGGGPLAHAYPQASRGVNLEGLPTSVEIAGRNVEVGADLEAQWLAQEYARSAGIDYDPVRTYRPADPARGERIAKAFDQSKDITDPSITDAERGRIVESYDALVSETNAQYELLKKAGFRFEFYPRDPSTGAVVNPYEGNPRLAIEDLKKNRHLYVYPTEGGGFGEAIITDADRVAQPLLKASGESWNGVPATNNDIFRAVHDYFGHFKEGTGFRAGGEENAWRSHSAMYSPKARPALTTELRGQNSWVNFGPFGKQNRTALQADTIYADQEARLLPSWVMHEGAGDPGMLERLYAALPDNGAATPLTRQRGAVGMLADDAEPQPGQIPLPLRGGRLGYTRPEGNTVEELGFIGRMGDVVPAESVYTPGLQQRLPEAPGSVSFDEPPIPEFTTVGDDLLFSDDAGYAVGTGPRAMPREPRGIEPLPESARVQFVPMAELDVGSRGHYPNGAYRVYDDATEKFISGYGETAEQAIADAQESMMVRANKGISEELRERRVFPRFSALLGELERSGFKSGSAKDLIGRINNLQQKGAVRRAELENSGVMTMLRGLGDQDVDIGSLRRYVEENAPPQMFTRQSEEFESYGLKMGGNEGEVPEAVTEAMDDIESRSSDYWSAYEQHPYHEDVDEFLQERHPDLIEERDARQAKLDEMKERDPSTFPLRWAIVDDKDEIIPAFNSKFPNVHDTEEDAIRMLEHYRGNGRGVYPSDDPTKWHVAEYKPEEQHADEISYLEDELKEATDDIQRRSDEWESSKENLELEEGRLVEAMNALRGELGMSERTFSRFQEFVHERMERSGSASSQEINGWLGDHNISLMDEFAESEGDPLGSGDYLLEKHILASNPIGEGRGPKTHFDEPNVAFHFSGHYDSSNVMEGRGYIAEEVQSDWAQKLNTGAVKPTKKGEVALSEPQRSALGQVAEAASKLRDAVNNHGAAMQVFNEMRYGRDGRYDALRSLRQEKKALDEARKNLAKKLHDAHAKEGLEKIGVAPRTDTPGEAIRFAESMNRYFRSNQDKFAAEHPFRKDWPRHAVMRLVQKGLAEGLDWVAIPADATIGNVKWGGHNPKEIYEKELPEAVKKLGYETKKIGVGESQGEEIELLVIKLGQPKVKHHAEKGFPLYSGVLGAGIAGGLLGEEDEY